MPLSAHAREITRKLPPGTPQRFLKGDTPLFTAYGCVLLEHDTGRSWAYRAVNLETGQSEMLARRARPIRETAYESMAEKISTSSIRGRSKLETDRRFGKRTPPAQLQSVQELLFRQILPQHGYAVREKQIELAEQILDATCARRVSLSEAEVGTGKTHAYLTAAVLAKRGRVNDMRNLDCYKNNAYAAAAHMPIVISTSSIALQRAIVRDYIPGLSDILMAHGIIKTPLSVAVRKGKEHYLCDHRLRRHIPFEHDENQREILEGLLLPAAPIDLAEVTGLTPHVKDKIHVPHRCEENCPRRDNCHFLYFLEKAQAPETDIQVCNHNYLLADTLRRAAGQRPLIPDYQCLVIDEAHKFLPAARQMYGVSLSSRTLPDIRDAVYRLKFPMETQQAAARKAARKLARQGTRLFRELAAAIPPETGDDEAERLPAAMGPQQTKHLRNIRDMAATLAKAIESGAGRKDKHRQVLYRLREIGEQAGALSKPGSLICWLEKPGGVLKDANNTLGTEPETLLHAIPKDLGARLRRDLWNRGIPVILTSGTLSVGGDFTHIKRTLGLNHMERLCETSKPSPFNHRENALLYISESMPFPDGKNPAYVAALTDEIERLIRAAHGHTAVLFTSHDTLGRVYAALKKRGLPFPMYRLGRGEVSAIERFKAGGKGVLLAAGAMWEGVDIPGDALSLLIIAKLPFAVPDPISDYERTLYRDMNEYKAKVIVPEMLIKLKQGFGRLIRTEWDTGAVAILDSRMQWGAPYRNKVLTALPLMRVTGRISDIARFMREKKAPGYFA